MLQQDHPLETLPVQPLPAQPISDQSLSNQFSAEACLFEPSLFEQYPPEQCFDDFVHLAAQLFQTPIAFILLTQADQSCVQASLGLEMPQLLTELSFWTQPIQHRDFVLVSDVLTQPDFAQDPARLAFPLLRFYAGVPLIDHQDQVVGVLGIAAEVPRQLQAKQIDSLWRLSRQVTMQLMLRQNLSVATTLIAEHRVQERMAQFQQALEFEALLKRITDKVRDSLDESQILQTAVQELALGLSLISCDTALYDLEQRTSTICYEYTTTDVSTQGIVWQMADFETFYNQLLQHQCFQFCDKHAIRGVLTLFACPIFDDKGILGDLWLARPKTDAFSEAEIRLVQQVANQCAIAIRQARLYQAAQIQVEQLEKLNQLKDDFLSTVSHELRTPVSNMRLAIQMLNLALLNPPSGPPMAMPDKVERYLQILHNECEREIGLINDLLDLQRLDAGAQLLANSIISLQDWFPKIIEPFQARAKNRQQTLELILDSITPITPIISDPSGLERITTELLNNACKYTPPGERIQVRVAVHANQFQLQVINFGCEIPEQELPYIFNKFYRVLNNDPWKQGGTGLGLALVQRLSQLLGGHIRAESHSGCTCFTVQLPLHPSG